VQRRLVGCILTRDEERRVERAVRSLQRVSDHVVVIDSESVDRTRQLAEAAGATVLTRRFDDYSTQRNWALREIEARFGDVFVLSIDADEWLSDELVHEIIDRGDDLVARADFVRMRRRHRFDGRVLRHGGFQQTWLVRLMRASVAQYEDRSVNEHVMVPDAAAVGVLHGWLEHDDVDSWERHVAKHNRYSTLEAAARVAGRETDLDLRRALRQPSLRRRWLREQVWDRLPARPAVRFLQIYVVSRGFLDGRPGFRRALFEAWQEMITDLKAEELRRGAR
jgi:glycosyltransferase involved in cell wall biosynthesis